MNQAFNSIVRFTLTPALSLRERENYSQAVGMSNVVRISGDAFCCPLSHRMGEGQGAFSFHNP